MAKAAVDNLVALSKHYFATFLKIAHFPQFRTISHTLMMMIFAIAQKDPA
jgi:hypothetical protein